MLASSTYTSPPLYFFLKFVSNYFAYTKYSTEMYVSAEQQQY